MKAVFAIMRLAPLALLLSLVGAEASASQAGDKTITKVVKLLQNMLEKSTHEGDEERKIYAKFKCYCDQSDAEKTHSIEESTTLISLLESEIEEKQGSNGELSSQCADLKASMADNEEKRNEATSIRNKQNKAFTASKADFEQAIGQMKSALSTLAAVGADQTQSTGADNKQFMAGHKGAALLSLKSTLQDALSAAEGFMNEKQFHSVASFLQAPFTGTYTSQSGAVLGIIKNMRDTFEANLADAIAQEDSELKAHNAFMDVKRDAHKDMKELYDEAQANLGENDEALSSKRSQLDKAEKEKANDEDFLEKLRPMCKSKGESYEERKMLRASEEAAVAEAVSILNSDSAFATFGGVDATSKGGVGFLQVVQKHFPGVSDEDVRQVMQRLLRRASAGRTAAPRLARVISALQAGNPFDTVLDEIEKMISLIGDEAQADKEKLDFCNKERKENKASLKEKKGEILTLDGEIDSLHAMIEDPAKGLKFQIANTEKGLQENHQSQVTETADRQEANTAYQADVKNLVAAEALLDNAIKVLNAYYDRFDSLLQSKEDPAPPATFDDKYSGQSKQGGSAIEMLEFILKETRAEETAAHSEEEKDQAEYEDSMESLKKEQAKKEKSLSELQDKLAQSEEALLSAEEDLKATTKDKEGIEDYLLKIKPGCDFITSNFKLRETNRGTEKKALETASSSLKSSPAYKSAVADATVASYGKCSSCEKDADDVECKACMAGTSIPGYCAGHKGTKGC